MQMRRVRSHEGSYVDNQKTQKLEQFLFKTQKCQAQHPISQRKYCPYYHDESDRRRDPHQFKYKCQMCPNQMCADGDQCQYSHNKVEQVYHPNRYKSKYCIQSRECEYGVYCSFAHGENELRLPIKLEQMVQDRNFWIYHYKTVWCPYIQGHDRASCVYAHNAQDFRRDSHLLEPKECPNWNKTDQVLRYDQGGCVEQENCPMCHGWKEYEYHPMIYKTKPCTQANCIKRECPFYHNEQERIVQQTKVEQNNAISMPRTPYKQQSNYSGPIIPKYIPQDLNRHKMEMGQPLELFSSLPHSRKGSDDRQKKKWTGQRKHHRTAPTTPDQKQQVIMKSQYSRQLCDELWKLSGSDFILRLLEGMKISEKQLMSMTDRDIQQLNLGNGQKQHLSQALNVIRQEKNYDEKHDSELLRMIEGQFLNF